MNKCDWIAHFAPFSQFVACLGRIVHHSPRYAYRAGKGFLLTTQNHNVPQTGPPEPAGAGLGPGWAILD